MREAGKAREKADLCVDEIQVRALACQDERTFPTFGEIYVWSDLCSFLGLDNDMVGSCTATVSMWGI